MRGTRCGEFSEGVRRMPRSKQHSKEMTDPKKGSIPAGHGRKTNSKMPEPTGAFALPPAKPEYYEEGGLRKVVPYQ